MLKSKKVTRSMAEYKEIITLMDFSFPEHERVPVWMLLLASYRKDIQFRAYYDEDQFVGISFVTATKKMAFLLFIAVNPNIQSRGYGSQILNAIRNDNTGRDISLNMEVVDESAENYKQRLSRLHFYEKNGFRDTGFRMEDDICDYSILSNAARFDPSECEKALGRLTFGLIKPHLKRHENVL